MMRTDIGVAVLGSGAFGANHVRVWRELGCLRAVVEPDPDARAATAARWPDVECTDDLPATLARPDVTAVVVATPPVSHVSLALQAMVAGKDVLVEKPMTLDEGDAERIVEASERLGRIVGVGHLLEHHPAVISMLEQIEAGALGNVQYVYSNRLSLGRIRTHENALWSFAPHDFALITRIMGGAPDDVACRGGAHVSEGIGDMAVATMTYSGNRQAHLFVSWLHPFKEHRLVVIGDRQMAVFDDTAPWDQKLVLYPYTVVRGGVGDVVVGKAEGSSVLVTPAEPLELECRDFLDSVRYRRRPRVDAHIGLRVVRVLAAAQRSFENGGSPQPVDASGGRASQIHPTASVHPSARIGSGVQIWHHSTVLDGACIGDRSMLGQNTFVGRHVRIGSGVRIQNNVSVYEGVELEDGVFCGPSVVFTNVGHPRAHVSRSGELLPTRVGRGATLGANSTIVCGVNIGAYAFVAAGAVVSRDVPKHALVIGVPARPSGWACVCGEKLLVAGDIGRCERCSMRFVGCETGDVMPMEAETDDQAREGRLA